MSEYKIIVTRKSDDELIHGKFKYIKREWIGNRWRYWYDKEDSFYFNGKKIVTSSKKVDIKPLNALSSIRATIAKVFKKPLSKTTLDEKLSKKVDTFIDKFVYTTSGNKRNYTPPSGVDHKYIVKVELPNGKYRYFYDMQQYETYLNRQNYQKNEPSFMKKVKEIKYSDTDKKTEEFSKENDLLITNKPYPTDGYTKNCAYCTAAYELRCRGYDVVASMDPEKAGESPNTTKKMAGWYKDTEVKTLKNMSFKDYVSVGLGMSTTADHTSFTASELENALSSYPPNSRGNLNVNWKDSDSGHSMIWETDSRGKVTIRDAQADLTSISLDKLSKYACNAEFYRTDNLELDESILEVFDENGK